MSPAELSRKSGLSPSTISDIESGKNSSTRRLSALAKALGANPMYLAEGSLPKESGSGDVAHGINEVRSEYTANRNIIEISRHDISASMGHGAIPPDHVDIVRNVIADVAELRKICTFTAPANLQIITGYGESMTPTFNDGDALLVDTGVREAKLDAIYLFLFDGELFIKRIQRMPGGTLRIISDNRQAYDSWDIPPSDMYKLNVQARVVLAWNARRL